MAPSIKIGAEPGGADKICPILYYFHRYYFGVHKSVHCPIFRSHSGVVEYHLRFGHAGPGSSSTFATLFVFRFYTKRFNNSLSEVIIYDFVTP